MWKYTRAPSFPREYVEQIERDPSCLVGTTWTWTEGGHDRMIVVREVRVPARGNPWARGAPEKCAVVRFYPVNPIPISEILDPIDEYDLIDEFFLPHFMECCVPWAPSTAPTTWERLLDGL